ncbi:3-oxo-5-alpha-steroid 4-dehydrogenase 2b isoform X2 [Halichoeres trimaculatus]|uniref:3-oxo-5-alpha-steroid 4-dehydrogenase 2b isoform X2 n=1 Tax=Halichoeres trimaculatus TaxID=147232 RepID=UPI003D9EA40C
MDCCEDLVRYLSYGMILTAVGHLVHHKKTQTSYGRHMGLPLAERMVPAAVAWFLQELPALLIPFLLLFASQKPSSMGRNLLLGTFCLHYFQRTFVYSLLTRGRPFPLGVMAAGGFFCTLNGSLQGHYLLHCAHFDEDWSSDYRFKIGLLMFYAGMAINIYSDCILRNLRDQGEVVYRIPKGGLFEYVSGANYFGEIVEWFGFAVVTWSLPALAFALFSLSFIGPRAYYHHRFYKENFKDYPKLRKALIPFIF